MRQLLNTATLCALTVCLTSTAMAEKLWVIAEKSQRIWIVDTNTNQRETLPISISDPDNDGTPDTPRGIAFSTTPAQRGTKALIAQGKLVTVVDVATRAVGPTTNIASLIGNPSLQLTGIATSLPRRFGTSSTTQSFVFLVGSIAATNDAPGSTVWIVLDQPRTIAGALTTSSRWFGPLANGFNGGSVQVLPTADGAQRQRAWYTLIDNASPPRVAAALLAQANSTNPTFSVERFEQRTMTGTAPAPTAIHLGAAPTADLTVMPWYSSGELENLQHGFSCSVGGRLSAVAITGPGVNSYTVFATDVLNNQLLVIDPANCSTAVRRPTGRKPISLTALGRNHWEAIFTTNYDSDSLTRLNRDGTQPPPIQLAPPGTICTECPVQSALALQATCVVEQLEVAESLNSLELSWTDQACASGGYDVFCRCLDKDPDCPCSCVCDGTSPPFGCECPGLDPPNFTRQSSTDDLGFALLPPPGGPDPSEDGWIKVGSTLQNQIGLPGYSGADWQAAYSIDPAEPPLP